MPPRRRIVVYFFPTKDDLIGEVLYAMGAALQATLAPVFSAPAADNLDLLRTAWPLLARPEADPEAWIEWAAEFIRGTRARRWSEAEAAIVVLDGLLLLRQLAGPEVADRAARRIGVTGRRRSD